jgi:hypothetical protein
VREYTFKPFFLTNSGLEQLAWHKHSINWQLKPKPGFVTIYDPGREFGALPNVDLNWIAKHGILLAENSDLKRLECISPSDTSGWRRNRKRWILVPTELCESCMFSFEDGRYIHCTKKKEDTWKVDVAVGVGQSIPAPLVKIWPMVQLEE